MLFLIIAFIIISAGIWCIYKLERKKRAAYLLLRKKRVFRAAKGKRRRRIMLDPDRGKVIPFPITAVSPQGDGPSDSRGTEKK